MSEESEPFSWWWKTKRTCKVCFELFRRFVIGFVWARNTSLFVDATCGAFLAVAGIWGTSWGWSEKQWFVWLVVGAAVAPFLIAIVQRTVGRAHPLESASVALAVQTDFIKTVGAIVDAKVTRFREALPEIRPNSDKFKRITEPVKQLRVIGTALAGFIRENFGLGDDQIDITILRRKPGGKWHYIYQYQSNWRHAEPPSELHVGTAAALCLSSGESKFYPDKFTAHRNDLYRLSKRDKERLSGSVFVYPVSYELPSGASEYVVSIVTYGQQLCSEHESQTTIDITSSFLRESCRRFELELCLETIKTCV